LPSESEKPFLLCEIFYVRCYQNLKGFIPNVRGYDGQSVSLHLVLFAVDGAVCMAFGIAKEHPILDRLFNKSMKVN